MKSPLKAAAKAPTIKRIPDSSSQLCRLVEVPPAQAGWGHEVKFDGYRLQLRVANGKATLKTRSALDWTDRFSSIAEEAADLPDCLIDGEVVALDKRRVPNFSALQAALSEGRSEDLVYFAFDLLFEKRSDLRPLPLSERKARLEQLLRKVAGEHIRYVSHLESRGDSVLKSACSMGLEGIVSKRLAAPYLSGRGDSWQKSKCRAGHEVVLGGWTTEAGTFRSLLAGVNRDGHLIYVGRIGTGYTRKTVEQLLPQLKALTVDESPFGGENAPRRERNIRWLRPELVAEIEFAGWTDSGMIRQAAFKGLRQDKPASEVVAEKPKVVDRTDPGPEDELEQRELSTERKGRSGAARPAAGRTTGTRTASARTAGAQTAKAGPATIMGVTISKPDKPLWPDAGDGRPVTKLDLARYFEQMGAFMLPHIEGRPCSMVRAPDGSAARAFSSVMRWRACRICSSWSR